MSMINRIRRQLTSRTTSTNSPELKHTRELLANILAAMPGARYVYGYLDPERIKPGERSLHIGSERSLVPFAEAFLGLEVIATDTRDGLAKVRATEESFLTTARSKGVVQLPITIKELDVLDFLKEYPADYFDHISCQNVLNLRALETAIKQKYGAENVPAVNMIIVVELIRRIRTGGTLSFGQEFFSLAISLMYLVFNIKKGDLRLFENLPDTGMTTNLRQRIEAMSLRDLDITTMPFVECSTLIDYGLATMGTIVRIEKTKS